MQGDTDMDGLRNAKRSEIDTRGLMSYPKDDADDLMRIDGIERLLAASSGTLELTLPGRDIVVPWDSTLPARLAYYLVIGDYEHHDIEMALEYTRPGDVVMELGGGVGITGSAFGRASGTPVVIVEPNPNLHAPITRTFQANGLDVILVAAAATGGSSGNARLTFGENYWWSSIESRAEDSASVEVATIGLDALIERYAPTVLSIDIEGHERSLVGTPLPDSLRLVLIEIHTPEIGSAETARLVTWLTSQGYEMIDVRSNSWAFQRRR